MATQLADCLTEIQYTYLKAMWMCWTSDRIVQDNIILDVETNGYRWDKNNTAYLVVVPDQLLEPKYQKEYAYIGDNYRTVRDNLAGRAPIDVYDNVYDMIENDIVDTGFWMPTMNWGVTVKTAMDTGFDVYYVFDPNTDQTVDEVIRLYEEGHHL